MTVGYLAKGLDFTLETMVLSEWAVTRSELSFGGLSGWLMVVWAYEQGSYKTGVRLQAKGISAGGHREKEGHRELGSGRMDTTRAAKCGTRDGFVW